MIKKVIRWYNVEERLPDKDGNYLAFSRNASSIITLSYVCKFKAFNCTKDDDKYKIEIQYWASLEDIAPEKETLKILKNTLF